MEPNPGPSDNIDFMEREKGNKIHPYKNVQDAQSILSDFTFRLGMSVNIHTHIIAIPPFWFAFSLRKVKKCGQEDDEIYWIITNKFYFHKINLKIKLSDFPWAEIFKILFATTTESRHCRERLQRRHISERKVNVSETTAMGENKLSHKGT